MLGSQFCRGQAAWKAGVDQIHGEEKKGCFDQVRRSLPEHCLGEAICFHANARGEAAGVRSKKGHSMPNQSDRLDMEKGQLALPAIHGQFKQ